MYRESQISSEKSNLGLYLPNNPSEWLFKKKMILENPQSLCIWRILEKFENSQKIPFLFMKLVKISDDFKQTVYTGAKKTPEDYYYYYGFFITIFIFILIYKAFPFLPSTFRLSCHFLKYKYSQRPRSLPSFFRGRLEEL